MKKYILLAFIEIMFLSCSDDDSNNTIAVLYKQTYCSDPWGYNNNDNELVDTIKNFFRVENIEITNITIDNKGTQEACLACTCLSGKRIIAKVSHQDFNTILQFGFEEFN